MSTRPFTMRQLVDAETSTYTYLLFDAHSAEAVFIDPVIENFERDQTLIKELGLQLKYCLETHVHADHVTSSYRFKEEHAAQVGVAAVAGAQGVDLNLEDQQEISFGEIKIEALSTPGHTDTCMSFHCQGALFTGDALLIRGCGRTDFQQGNPDQLFESVRKRLFSFPDSTSVFPGHDYKGRLMSTIGEEKKFNPRLKLENSKEQFVEIMNGLNLPKPKKIDVAVPANLQAGKLS